MKALPIVLAALMVATTATAQSRPNYSPAYVAQIDQNLQRVRAYCAKLEAAKKETYDDERLIGMLRALEGFATDLESGKIDNALLGAARRSGRVTQADVDCMNAMAALEAYVIRLCQTEPGSCTYN